MSEQNLKPTDTSPDFWQDKWKKNEIVFHQSNNHAYLVKNLSKLLEDNKTSRILFPFCGKAVDMAWLASMGHEIIGVEFVQIACEQFFTENNLKYTVTDLGDLKLYQSEDKRIKIYNGDFFKFNTKLEKPFECVWDRGAYGALHYELRVKYAQHMKTLLSDKVRYLLDVFDYDTSLYPGPPHACKMEEIQQLFGNEFKLELIESEIWGSSVKMYHDRQVEMFDKLYYLTRN